VAVHYLYHRIKIILSLLAQAAVILQAAQILFLALLLLLVAVVVGVV
jgi:hypothetical protein